MQLLTWWYNWGLFLFLLLDLIAIFWIVLDTAGRRTNALAWRMGAIFPVLLVLPSFFYKFSSLEARVSLENLVEPFFWLGLLGGLIPLVLAFVYALTPARSAPEPYPYPPPPPPVPVPVPPPVYPPAPVRPARPKAAAWLVVHGGPGVGRSFQLNVGDTRVGRSAENDIVLEDPEVSKQHVLIREQGGRFTIQDVGSTNGTFVNGQRLYSVQMLYDGDQVQLGQTLLVFKQAF